MARLSLSVLGPLQVTLDDRTVTGFEYDKVRALLIYLVVEAASAHRRGALAGLLWPDLPEDTARRNLSQALTTLRRAIGDHRADAPFLLVTRDTVQFNSASDHVLDVATFTTLLAACATHAHRQPTRCRSCMHQRAEAVAFYRGDFLAEFVLTDSAAFEEWTAVKREQMHAQALRAYAHLASSYEQQGAYEEAQHCAGRRVELDPWSEDAYQQLMRILWLSGQRSAALAQYEGCRRVLAKELGVEPAAETTALYEHIRDTASAEVSAQRDETRRLQNFPAQTTALIGRESELAELGTLLENPACRLITIVGPGGIGKTRLALATASEQAAAFTHGAAFVSLAAISSVALVAPTILAALAVALQGQRDPRDQLIDLVRGKELLLVLDNLEQLLAPSHPLDELGNRREAGVGDLLVDLLQRAPGVTLLVTSRERVGLLAEWLFDVPGLNYAVGEPSDDLASYSAVQLFVQRARQLRPQFTLVEGEAHAVARICRLVEGLPLALELAAAALHARSSTAIADALASSTAALARGRRIVPERHRSMWATFEHSWRLLSADERQVLPRLAVFRGGFEEKAAAQVAQASPDLLAGLVDKSLLRWGGTGRYSLHELVRQYAREKLERTGEATDTRRRHAHYFLELAETAADHLRSPELAAWVARLEAEHDNLRAALEWVVDREEAELGSRLCIALYDFWDYRGDYTEVRHWLQAVLALPGPVTPLLHARTMAIAGLFATDQGDTGMSIALLEEALTLVNAHGDTADIAKMRFRLAHAWLMAGDYLQAVPGLEECLAWARGARDVWFVAWSLESLGRAAYEQGALAQAKPLLEESLRLYRAHGSMPAIAWVLSHASSVALYEGKYEQAISLAEETLALFRELESQHGIAWMVGTLGWVALQQDDVDGAVAQFKQSLTLFREMGDMRNIAFRLEALAAASVKDHKEPAQAARRAARLFGAAAALRDAQGVRLPPADESLYRPYVAAARAELDEGAWAAAWAEGRAMTLEQAIVYALEETP